MGLPLVNGTINRHYASILTWIGALGAATKGVSAVALPDKWSFCCNLSLVAMHRKLNLATESAKSKNL